MTPADLKFWMASLHYNKVQAAAYLGIARTTLNRYLDGKTPIPKLVEIAISAKIPDKYAAKVEKLREKKQ